MATASLKRASIALVAVGALVASIVAASSPLVSPGAAGTVPPNIVVVISDDQPPWTVEGMPFVSHAPGFQPFGALYDNYALCCPARATFLTGLNSHHTSVERNDGTPFDDSSTLATWLDDAGYETGLFGKYLNKYPFDRGGDYVPEGWDRWAALDTSGSGYYDYNLHIDGALEPHGHETADYSTDVIADLSEDFVGTADEPFFALVAPHGPHSPFTPADRHAGTLPRPPWPPAPNFNRRAKRAPGYYRELPRVKRSEQRSIAHDQEEALLSIDEMTERLVTAADARDGETIVLYLSDNGLSLGSHRLPRKRCGYEECGSVPGLIRAPGDPSGLLASNADLAPTLAELAGVEAPPTDGESLVDEMLGGAQDPGKSVLLRNRGTGELPAFWGLRTGRWKYLEHAPRAGEPRFELYDLDADPAELRNRHGQAAYAIVEADLSAHLETLRSAPPAR